MSSQFISASLTNLSVPLQVVFEIAALFAVKTFNSASRRSSGVRAGVCLPCAVLIPAVREHDQRAAEAARLRGAVPAGAGGVHSGGHFHGDAPLPRQPPRRRGLLSAGTAGFDQQK